MGLATLMNRFAGGASGQKTTKDAVPESQVGDAPAAIEGRHLASLCSIELF
jgi:hypothetical protein